MDGIMMQADILVMYANSYDMKGEDGRSLSGVSLEYFIWQDGKPFIAEHLSPGEVADDIGVKSSKCSLPLEEVSHLVAIPGIYTGNFTMSVNKDRKGVLKLMGIEYKQGCTFTAGDPKVGALAKESKDSMIEKK